MTTPSSRFPEIPFSCLERNERDYVVSVTGEEETRFALRGSYRRRDGNLFGSLPLYDDDTAWSASVPSSHDESWGGDPDWWHNI